MEQQEKIRLSELAKKLGGRLVGEDIPVKNFSSIEQPKPDSVVLLTHKKFLDLVSNSNILAVVVFSSLNISLEKPHVVVDDDKLTIVKMLEIFYPEEQFSPYLSFRASISKSAKIGDNCYIDDFVVISDGVTIGDNCFLGAGVKIGKNVTIGNNVKIYPNVVIYNDTVIGSNVIIHAGTVIGSDGFGYVNLSDKHVKIRQVGNVIIEDNVEIGANCCIDRATLSATVIGEGTKIDNLVQIGHNVKIGKNCIIVAQVGIAGSCNIGNYVILAGQVGVGDHVSIADGTIVMAQSGVMSDIESKGVYLGSPIIESKQFMKNYAVFKELYSLKKDIDKLKGSN
ncbi:MAG: UDP-3-O-(3-hydroxymyristoyl)glucosamine N-acyltransferase [Calditerrivibrio sp.]|nr:UDP-3-O-(3-hydroxymyristoyl)glucosamine N-acyltransferase [Calditerrivibrio sp.]